MLGGIRPIATLSSGLLARKGHARPAMRPQGFAGPIVPTVDDLGWNDMGAPEPAAEPSALPASEERPVVDLPPVLVERSVLLDEVARIVPSEPAASALVALIHPDIARPDIARTGKAAFTLRLAADRHLRLRLAAAVTHRSAQAIVTEALDAFLSTLPEVEELAGRCSTPDLLGNRS
ncbi:hypothetical protein [uncultured Sphingomonas sp.]|uniref:hypothetical protein n=1 Tax=uncultured Sphingomonas sp. TaxID=158754 RepID=UPI0035CC8D83